MRDQRYIDLAIKLSFESEVKQQKMAAVVVKGGNVLSLAVNHRMNHAESRALRRFGANYRGATIYVARWNARCSKPCPECQPKIISAGISRVVYIDLDQTITSEKIRHE